MNNKELKRYIETKIKLLQIKEDEDKGYYEPSDTYEVAFEDGEIKGAIDALLMVLVLMDKSDE